MNRQSFGSSMIAASMIVGSLAASGTSARADSEADKVCSNRTLRGDYGFAVEGLILPAPGVTVPLRGVTITHFDGKGNLTQLDSLLVNGGPISDWSPVTGTYQVNADCTGTMNLLPSTGGFANLRIVVVRQGKEIHSVVWPPFDGPDRTVTSIGKRVE